MANTTVSGIISDVKHAGTSRNGNPRYAVTVDGTTYRTKVDASIGYSATNYAPDSRESTPRTNVLVLDGRGSVVDITGPESHDNR